MTVDLLHVYCDGACFRNPGGPGGWGVVALRAGAELLARFGGEPETTNNRMELMGAIMALELTSGPVLVRSDSKYVVNGITVWVAGWKKRNWTTKGGRRNGAGEPVKNRDLWERLDDLRSRRAARFEWVRGHAGNAGNERADELATAGALQAAGITMPFESLLDGCRSCKNFIAPRACRQPWMSLAYERSPLGACGPDRRNFTPRTTSIPEAAE